MTDDRLLSPIPAPSEAQLEAGANADPNARLVDPAAAQPELSDDQINTSIDGNAPHTQPDGEFSGSQYPVDPANPNEIESADARLGNVAGVDDLDEDGQPRNVDRGDTAAAAERRERGAHAAK